MARKRSADDDYGQHREAMAERSRDRSAKGRDIGAIPDIANVRRRAKCRKSLRLFCETYNPAAFEFGWSKEHLTAIARIEEAATLGALYAFAMARGSGKTTICRMGALWAMSFRHCRYAFLIGATDDKAKESLDTLRVLVRFLPDYAADFPEISFPAQALSGIATRAHGQTSRERSTLIEWAADRIVLPTVAPPANWPKSWKLRDDGMVPTSGSVVSASGLTGEGIRGSLKALSTGEMVRPDLVLLDDPQTPESARSPVQNAQRLKLIEADVLGMAGPGAQIAAVMPCTVIERGDCIDQVLDRTRHPMWRGERSGILRSMPADMDGWHEYFEVYARCAQLEPPDFAESNAHYRRRQEALERGVAASWPERKGRDEVSAVQHAMHLYFRNPGAFMAEYQNEPLAEGANTGIRELTVDEVAGRLSALPRGHLPPGTTRITGGIDIQGKCLFWLVAAWDEHFGGAVIDYGVFPRQNRAHFAASDARPTLEDVFPGMSEQGRIYAGLEATVELIAAAYPDCERLLIDCNWAVSTDPVAQYVAKSPHRRILFPSRGKGLTASMNSMDEWARPPGTRWGRDWIVRPAAPGKIRALIYETNSWKTFVVERLQVPAGQPSGLWVFGDQPHLHGLFADHVCAEYREDVQSLTRGRRVQEWHTRPGQTENHWFDCLVMSAVAAEAQGLKWSTAQGPAGLGGARAPAPKKQGRTMEELYAVARAKKEAR